MGLIAYFDPGDKLRRMAAMVDDPEPLMDVCGGHMLAETEESFREGGYAGDRWDDHPVPRWQNIMADLIEGREEPRSGLTEKGQTLVDKGQLRNSFSWERLDRWTMAYGSNLKYSGKLDRGEEDEIGPWSRDVRRRLYIWYKKQNDFVRAALGWLLNEKWLSEPVEFQHPERPMVGLVPSLTERIIRDIQYEIVGA